MSDLYPFVFKPLLLEKEFWGGRRLAPVLAKQLPPGRKIGESWEISDYPGKETAVANGPLAGTTLRSLVEDRAEELVGDPAILQAGRFPLLVKYIDASETLSVQVHPDDDYARKHGQSAGKKEAWYIIAVDRHAKLIRGVTEKTTRKSFAEAIDKGELDPRLHAFEPKPGDAVMIPWGMVHAIGKGIVLAEIQQTSDVTYRVYDWNRVDENGEGRELHVEDALNVIEFKPPDRDTCERKLLDDGPCKRHEAVRCDKFVIEVIELNGELAVEPPARRFTILNVVSGSAEIESSAGTTPLALGSSVLVPAALPAVRLRGDGATVLRSYVP